MTEQPKHLVGGFSMKSAFDATTRVVLDDEPCFFLGEFNLPSRSGKSKSRYQVLRVVRNDRLVTAYVYLGPAKKFESDQFTMLGGVVNDDGRGEAVHTVAELREGADEIRSRPPRREMEPSDLQAAFQNYVEEKDRRKRHRSTFGAGGVFVR